MNNGTSTVFKGLSGNLFAAILLFAGAFFAFMSGFFGWLGFVMLGVSALAFLIERNTFPRRASFNLMLLFTLTIVSWLLFVLLLHWKFFATVNWIIDIAVTLFLVFAGLCALNGKRADIPFLGGFIDSVVG